jgi:hypothetical protein
MLGLIPHKTVIQQENTFMMIGTRKEYNSVRSRQRFDNQPTSASPRCLPSIAAAEPSLPLAAVTRTYLRSLRAAEMVMWEITGGDYLLSGLCSDAK